MKNPISILSLLLISNMVSAQFNIKWQKCVGGYDREDLYYMDATPDGGVVMAGGTYSNDEYVTGQHGNWDGFLVKLDANGAIQWQRCFGGSEIDVINNIHPTSDGGYIFSGFTSSVNGDLPPAVNQYQEACVVKLDASGNTEWIKLLGGSRIDLAYDIQQDADGGYIMAGATGSTDGDVVANHDFIEGWLVKLSSTGELLWQKTYGGNSDDYFFAIKTTTDGGYIVTGETYSTDGDISGQHGETDICVLKINHSGDVEWEKSIGGSDRENAGTVIQCSDGGYLMVGSTLSSDGNSFGNHGARDVILVKFNANGGIQWKKLLGSLYWEEGESLCEMADGGFLVGTYTGSDGASNIPDALIIKVNASGNVEWQEALGGSSYEEARSIVHTADGNYVMAGTCHSNDGDVSGNHGGDDYWIVKLQSGAVDTHTPSIAGTLTISPNPVQEHALISIPEAPEGEMDIRVVDMMGRVVLSRSLQNGQALDVSGLVEGCYVIEANSTDGYVFSGKLIKQ